MKYRKWKTSNYKESKGIVIIRTNKRLTKLYHHGKMVLGKATDGNFKSLAMKMIAMSDKL